MIIVVPGNKQQNGCIVTSYTESETKKSRTKKCNFVFPFMLHLKNIQYIDEISFEIKFEH